jgi:hypothetical protein
MNWTSLRDLQEPRALLRIYLSNKLKPPLNAIDVSLFGVALSAINGVHPGIMQVNRDLLQGPAFTSRIQRDRHRRSCTERGQQQFIWGRPCVGTAIVDRLIGIQPVRTRIHGLGEA